jgi:DNA-binding winged helix-turn-helix (wHTH) protein
MEPQVFDVLAHLLEHRDRVITKQELFDKVWANRFVTEATLSSRLMAARKAVGDSGRSQQLILTVHGRGYRFVGAVRTRRARARRLFSRRPLPQRPWGRLVCRRGSPRPERRSPGPLQESRTD